MAGLPRVSGADADRAFAKVGYEVARQRGSHIRLRHVDGSRPSLTVPNHKELKAGFVGRLAHLHDDDWRFAQIDWMVDPVGALGEVRAALATPP